MAAASPLRTYLLSAPPGLLGGFQALNTILASSPQETLTVVERIWAYVSGEEQSASTGPVTAKQALEILGNGGNQKKLLSVDAQVLSSALNSLTFLYRGVIQQSASSVTAASSATSVADASIVAEVLHHYTDLSTNTIDIIIKPLAERDQTGGKAKATKLLTIGKLVKIEWTLGVAIASSTCKNLSAPFVRLVFHLRESDEASVVSVELSYNAFQDLLDTFTEISQVMDKL